MTGHLWVSQRKWMTLFTDLTILFSSSEVDLVTIVVVSELLLLDDDIAVLLALLLLLPMSRVLAPEAVDRELQEVSFVPVSDGLAGCIIAG